MIYLKPAGILGRCRIVVISDGGQILLKSDKLLSREAAIKNLHLQLKSYESPHLFFQDETMAKPKVWLLTQTGNTYPSEKQPLL